MSGDRNAMAVTPVVTLSTLPLKSFSRGESYASADKRVADIMGLTKRFTPAIAERPQPGATVG